MVLFRGSLPAETPDETPQEGLYADALSGDGESLLGPQFLRSTPFAVGPLAWSARDSFTELGIYWAEQVANRWQSYFMKIDCTSSSLD